MNIRYFHIGLAVWIFALVSAGFSESFPNRPTVYDLVGIVNLGEQCVLGTHERCLATQCSTNPVSYSVSSPFVKTNSTGWYLDQSLMGTMASTIKSLVPYFADQNTVYNGTTNILMYTVAELFADLGVGNREDQFTQTFVSGTNAAVYGDTPWRISGDNLYERAEVLGALQKRLLLQFVGGETNFAGFAGIHDALFYGEADGDVNLYYTYSSGNLGPAWQTYPIKLDERALGGSGGQYYISLGQAAGGWGMHSGQGSLGIYLDTGSGSDEVDYSARVTFAAKDALQVVNCWYTGGGGATLLYSPYYTTWQAGASATLDTSIEGVAAFEIYPVLTFPFEYQSWLQ